MDNPISASSLKEILSNFPTTTKTIFTHRGYLFTFENSLICFCKSPFTGITFSFDFKILNKVLDSFDAEEEIFIKEDMKTIVFKSKNTSLEILSCEETQVKIVDNIKEILSNPSVYVFKDKEGFKESILFASSVARKDNLSGVLDHIFISKNGEIFSSDNVRALRVKTKESFPDTISLEAKKAQYFFKSKDITKIVISEKWTTLYEKSTKMFFSLATPSPSVGKFPVKRFQEFFENCASSEGSTFQFPEQAKSLLRKVAHFAEGKNEISKTVTLEFKPKKIICSVLIPGGKFTKEVPCKNSNEFRMTLNPGLFISPDDDINLKFLQNSIYYKKDNFEYIMAVGE